MRLSRPASTPTRCQDKLLLLLLLLLLAPNAPAAARDADSGRCRFVSTSRLVSSIALCRAGRRASFGALPLMLGLGRRSGLADLATGTFVLSIQTSSLADGLVVAAAEDKVFFDLQPRIPVRGIVIAVALLRAR